MNDFLGLVGLLILFGKIIFDEQRRMFRVRATEVAQLLSPLEDLSLDEVADLWLKKRNVPTIFRSHVRGRIHWVLEDMCESNRATMTYRKASPYPGMIHFQQCYRLPEQAVWQLS